ncbi:MAG: hypothetical protein HY329_01275 [Chloroflexi bacterium]|nr:hypothetical protein [Chloroflexota bacterium]
MTFWQGLSRRRDEPLRSRHSLPAIFRSLWQSFRRDLRLPASDATTSPRIVIVALFLGLAFAAFNQIGVPLRASHSARVTADEPFYLLTAVSLIEDGDLDLQNDYDLRRYRTFFDHPDELWYQSVRTVDGRLLSPHNVGTSLLILPAYALGGLDGVKRFLGALGGLTITFAVLLAYRITGRLVASSLAGILLGLSAPLVIYATQIYPEAPGALLVTAAVWLLLGRTLGTRAAVLLAALLVGLAWLGTKYLVIGALLALLALTRLGRSGRLVLVTLLGLNASAYLGFHLATYGGLTPYSVNQIYAGSSTLELVGRHLELWNRLYRLAGLWVDGEFGVIRWAPALIIGLVGFPLLLHRPGPARWAVPLVFGAQLLVAVFLSITMRGWWFPGRMLVVVLPLLAVPLAHALALAQRRVWLAAVVTVLGLSNLGITLALRTAAAAELVVLAVDPFALPAPLFRWTAGLFPVYTVYTASTWLLTALWLFVAAVLWLAGNCLDRQPARIIPAGVPSPAGSEAALEPSK